MKFQLPACLLIAAMTALSCESSKVKSDAENVAKKFFTAIKEKNETEMSNLYPGIKKLTYFKSDSVRINNVSIKDDLVTVSAHNRFVNGLGKTFEQDILLFFRKSDNNELSLFDSKGLEDFSIEDQYIFALNTGCIDKATDTTDQMIVRKLEESGDVMVDKARDIFNDLKENIKIRDWELRMGYGNSASGAGIVYNGSGFSIPRLKYKVIYMDDYGRVVTTDGGYITNEPLKPGESRSFSVYTNYIGAASHAKVEPDLDAKLIVEYLAKKTWTGRECTEYYRTHPKK